MFSFPHVGKHVVVATLVCASGFGWFGGAPAFAGGGCACNGDVDSSGQTNFVDIDRTLKCILGQPGFCNPLMDVDCGGTIDWCDVQSIICRFQNRPPSVCCGLPCGGCCVGGTHCAAALQSDCPGVFLGAGVLCRDQNAAIFPEGNGTVFVHEIGAPADCTQPPFVASRAGCPPSGPYDDPWVSNDSGTRCHNFGSPDTDPVPAGFFGAASDAYTGTVCLNGSPLGIPQYGDADTVIRRSADPFGRCALPGGGPSTVDLEIVQLSLVSATPITVTYNGGQNPEQWDVSVDLAPGGPQAGTPPSTLTATKTNCNGGKFTSVLYVQPRFTFVKVGEPTTTRVLDTRATGTDPVQLVQSSERDWAVDVDPILSLHGDPCTSFHPGVTTGTTNSACDCNGNLLHDLCDIDAGVASDCNSNLLPDSCDIATGRSQDVNADTVPDECPAVGPTVGDDICVGGAAATFPCTTSADCPGGTCRLKNRFITATIPASAASHGIKVNLVLIDANSAASPQNYNGTDRWASAPLLNVPDGVSPAFNAAQVQCALFSNNWSAIGRLHIYGDVIVPGSQYDVSICSPLTLCSPALRIGTAKFGDVILPTPAVNFQDVQSIVAKFQGAPAGPSKTRSDLVAGVLLPNNPINFQDVSANVSAFQSKAFKTVVTTPPATCP